MAKYTPKRPSATPRVPKNQSFLHNEPVPEKNPKHVLPIGIAGKNRIRSRVHNANRMARMRAFGRLEGMSGIGFLRAYDIKLMMDLQDWSCIYCKDKVSFDTCEFDHVYPIIKGGDHYLYNIIISCRLCNQTKHDRTLRNFCKKVGLDFEVVAQEIAEIYCAIHKELYGNESAPAPKTEDDNE